MFDTVKNFVDMALTVKDMMQYTIGSKTESQSKVNLVKKPYTLY